MKNLIFPEIQERFGFGCMRFPMIGDEVDLEQTKNMIDLYLQRGFNYFDTAHGYINGKSELAIKECLTSRYPREAYILTNKLSNNFFQSQEEIRPLFEKQLLACGVSYFDFYLMHCQNKELFEKYKKCHAYETAFELKKEGKVRHVGLSFHDTADVLEEILETYPEVEVVQLQFNYLDYESPSVQSRLCYEVCVKHHKPVIVMEPVRGGQLANLFPLAEKKIDEMGRTGSNASYALRFCASFENIFMILSGMSTVAQVEDNISFMKDVKALSEKEIETLLELRKIIVATGTIACTGCHYCTEGCPMQIPIPEIFNEFNMNKIYGGWNSQWYYKACTSGNGHASDCLSCGQCENVCPQKLPIRDFLKQAAEIFDGEKN